MPPAPCPPAIHTLSAFSDTDAIRILSSAKRGEIHVVSAAPGQGKSTKMRVEIAARLLVGTWSQVLWAVQAIEGEDSLGQEALEHFIELGVHAEIVYGTAHFDESDPAHDAQFDWLPGPSVKIISHARLSMAFGGNHYLSSKLATAELLVIDEDPSGGILLASPNEPPSAGSEEADLRLDALRPESRTQVSNLRHDPYFSVEYGVGPAVPVPRSAS